MGFLTDWLKRTVSDADMETINAKIAQGIAYKDLATYIATTYIANTISKCEFKVFKDGKEVKDEFYYLMNVNPNPNQNSSQFLNKLITELYECGDALVVPIKNSIYVADCFSIDEKPLGENLFSGINIEKKQLTKKYKASEVFYFKLDEKKLRAYINMLFETYGTIVAAAFSSYKRGNGKKYKLVMDSMKAGDKDFVDRYNTVIKTNLQSFVEGDNSVFPQFKGTDLQDIASGGVQNAGDIISLRKELFEIVAQAFKIPLPMMYGNITNINEIVKVFLTFCIDPLADMIEEELTRKTNSFTTWNGGKNYVRVDTSCINHIDLFDIANACDKIIGCGIYSIDDVRIKLDEIPLNTELSQKHFVTKNYADVENIQNEKGGEME